jgi:carboxyl-terminal processing protease
LVLPERLQKASAVLGESPWLEGHLQGLVEASLEGMVGEPLHIRFADTEGKHHDLELTLGQKPGLKFEVGNLPGHYVSIETARPSEGVGYISLSQFSAPGYVMPRFNEAVQELGDCRGIILDLRGNSGGMATMVIGVARWFLSGEARDLGTAITRDTSLRFLVPSRPNAYPGQIAILIDGGSGSGSEVLAGGLQAIGRARVFGSRSMGAVLASAIVELPNGDCLQYAFADFVDPHGARLEGIGVRPDVEVRPTQAQLATGEDPVIEAAIHWIRSS